MYALSPAEAISEVRKNLDEQGLNDSVMYTDESSDNESLDLIISRTLPEAINAVCIAASSELLEGESVKDSLTDIEVKDNILSFTVPSGENFLRLVVFKAADTPHIVTDVLAEASTEGRKQLNKYVRGTYDNPRLVQVQGNTESPSFRYYSLKDDSQAADSSVIETIDVVRRQKYDKDTLSYKVPTGLREQVIYHLTGMVLSIYGETDKAKYYFGTTQE